VTTGLAPREKSGHAVTLPLVPFPQNMGQQRHEKPTITYDQKRKVLSLKKNLRGDPERGGRVRHSELPNMTKHKRDRNNYGKYKRFAKDEVK